MDWKIDQSELYTELEPVIRGMGYSLVELSRQATKGRLQIRAVIYHYNGIGLADCELVHKTILPRLELLEESEDIYLEVTSPGVTRKIKNGTEFAVFIDRPVRILLQDADDWLNGTILGANENEVQLRTEQGEIAITLSDIKKAKLAFSQEDKKTK